MSVDSHSLQTFCDWRRKESNENWKVYCIRHHKELDPPFHEYLIVRYSKGDDTGVEYMKLDRFVPYEQKERASSSVRVAARDTGSTYSGPLKNEELVQMVTFSTEDVRLKDFINLPILVNILYPNYQVLFKQCYFFAYIIIRTVKNVYPKGMLSEGPLYKHIGGITIGTDKTLRGSQGSSLLSSLESVRLGNDEHPSEQLSRLYDLLKRVREDGSRAATVHGRGDETENEVGVHNMSEEEKRRLVRILGLN